ncbi:NUDIX domain-containing protein [Nocardioides sp. C4-1]|uniref:NUDIX hydrolase n=1 Tax=Nocardioides sp. C4-1 TaxID=3151851 RepID=UPI003262E29D
MSLHADALAVLRAWTPPTPVQESLRQRYVAHLEAHPDGMTRACRPDHVTASTLVLSHDRREVLLTLHAKAEQWFQLGGHAEPDDATLAGAARREADEESGVAGLVVHPVPVHLDEHAVAFCRLPDGGSDDQVVHHLDVRFVAVAPPGARHVVSEESLDVRWWPVDDVPNPDLVPLVQSALDALDEVRNSEGGVMREASDQPSR